MKYPDKLIVVGMRYQPEAQNFLRSISPKYPVSIWRESSGNGTTNEVTYAVTAFIEGGSSIRLGYIRNIDIPLLDRPSYLNVYEITSIRTNYLTLKLSDNMSSDSMSSDNAWDVPKYDEIPDKKETKMNTNSMRDSFFREVKNAVLDITTGSFGIVTADGISVYKDGAVSVNPLVDMGVKVPAFAMRVDVATLTEGDIILNGNTTYFYKGKTETGYEIVAMNGEVKQVGAVTNLFFGKNTVLAIKNMMAGTGMNPLIMAMMMGDTEGKGFNMKTFALMSMLGAKSENGGMDSNMLMMMLMMDK
jgi:hypothetical protein